MIWCIKTYIIAYVKILFIFFKYSCTNIFHRRSLYTFYDKYKSAIKESITTHRYSKYLFENTPIELDVGIE